MKTITTVFLLLNSCCIILKAGMKQDGMSADLDLRLLVREKDPSFLCRIGNPHPIDTLQYVASYDNSYNGFTIYRLDSIDSARVSGVLLGEVFRVSGDFEPTVIKVAPGATHTTVIALRQFFLDPVFRDVLRGKYNLWRWRVAPWKSKVTANESDGIYLAFPDAAGNIVSPVVDPRSHVADPILAFIFHENRPHELGFLFLNGSRRDIGVEKPLTKESRIVASSLAIGCKRELFIAASTSERIVVKAGEVGEWRVPWPKVLELIPKEDLERIKKAGGDLDLVWKVGEYESQPLPLSLADPEEIEKEIGAETSK